jgi:hypothetical protein
MEEDKFPAGPGGKQFLRPILALYLPLSVAKISLSLPLA